MTSKLITKSFNDVALRTRQHLSLNLAELAHVYIHIVNEPMIHVTTEKATPRIRDMAQFPCSSWNLSTVHMNSKGELYPCLPLQGRAEYDLRKNGHAVVKSLLRKEITCFDCTMMCDGFGYVKEHFGTVLKFYAKRPKLWPGIIIEMLTNKKVRSVFR